jgi:hypothetical protein
MTNDQLKQRAISEAVEVLKQNQNETLNHDQIGKAAFPEVGTIALGKHSFYCMNFHGYFYVSTISELI